MSNQAFDAKLEELLQKHQQQFADAVANQNPPPADGRYSMILKSFDYKEWPAKDGRAGRLSFNLKMRCVDDGELDGYEFSHSPGDMDLLSFGVVQKGGPIGVTEIGRLLKAAVDETTVYQIQVSRTPKKDKPGEFWTNVKAVGKA